MNNINTFEVIPSRWCLSSLAGDLYGWLVANFRIPHSKEPEFSIKFSLPQIAFTKARQTKCKYLCVRSSPEHPKEHRFVWRSPDFVHLSSQEPQSRGGRTVQRKEDEERKNRILGEKLITLPTTKLTGILVSNPGLRKRTKTIHFIYTHTHTHIYIYIYTYRI